MLQSKRLIYYKLLFLSASLFFKQVCPYTAKPLLTINYKL